MSLVREFWDFMKTRKKFMLAPVIVILVALSGLIALAASSPVISGLLYSIF
jgi:hypothetical protein